MKPFALRLIVASSIASVPVLANVGFSAFAQAQSAPVVVIPADSAYAQKLNAILPTPIVGGRGSVLRSMTTVGFVAQGEGWLKLVCKTKSLPPTRANDGGLVFQGCEVFEQTDAPGEFSTVLSPLDLLKIAGQTGGERVLP